MSDLIDRQAAIDAVNDVITDYIPTLYGRFEKLPLELALAIKRLPSAHPERKTGEWMLKRVRDDGHGTVTFQMICSKCGEPAHEFDQPYCHHCGAKMYE